MLELSRIVTSAGVVAASVGLIVYGVGASYVVPNDFETSLGIWLMVIGTIVTVIGAIAYNRSWVEAED
jgi:hypothetical protein